MEYDKKNLKNREELAQMVVDTYQALANYRASMHNEDKEEVRKKAHLYFRKREQLLEASRSILVCANLKD